MSDLHMFTISHIISGYLLPTGVCVSKCKRRQGFGNAAGACTRATLLHQKV